MPPKLPFDNSFSGWMSWATRQEDPDAKNLLEMLKELGEVLELSVFNRIASSGDAATARQIHKKWNEQASVLFKDRDEMRKELGKALDLVDGSRLDSITTYRDREPNEGDWPRNVYIVDQSAEIGLKAAVCKSTGDISAHRGPGLMLDKMTLDEGTLSALQEHPQFKSLVFRNCKYPEDWDDGLLAGLGLRKLVFYACNRSSRPESRLASLQACPSLRVLELIMADFVHDVECYANLGRMRQLSILNISRTMTLEKAKIEDENALDLMMDALLSLIKEGDLIELNVAYCSSFKRNHLLELAEGLARKNGRLIISMETATGNRLRE